MVFKTTGEPSRLVKKPKTAKRRVLYLLVTGHLALQLQVLLPQPLSLLLVRQLLRLLPNAELAHRLVPSLLLRLACHANTFLPLVLESSLD